MPARPVSDCPLNVEIFFYIKEQKPRNLAALTVLKMLFIALDEEYSSARDTQTVLAGKMIDTIHIQTTRNYPAHVQYANSTMKEMGEEIVAVSDDLNQ